MKKSCWTNGPVASQSCRTKTASAGQNCDSLTCVYCSLQKAVGPLVRQCEKAAGPKEKLPAKTGGPAVISTPVVRVASVAACAAKIYCSTVRVRLNGHKHNKLLSRAWSNQGILAETSLHEGEEYSSRKLLILVIDEAFYKKKNILSIKLCKIFSSGNISVKTVLCSVQMWILKPYIIHEKSCHSCRHFSNKSFSKIIIGWIK